MRTILRLFKALFAGIVSAASGVLAGAMAGLIVTVGYYVIGLVGSFKGGWRIPSGQDILTLMTNTTSFGIRCAVLGALIGGIFLFIRTFVRVLSQRDHFSRSFLL